MVIAIDGPAGAGKSTVARAVARELSFAYLDSGAMYRCVALLALASPGEEPARVARAARIELGAPSAQGQDGAQLPRVTHGNGDRDTPVGYRVLLDGRDVSEEIRAPEVSEMASRVAADPGVREALVATQRRQIADGDWVAEGRDIGTVVAPDAELKIYLTADPEERADRRAVELGLDREAVLAELKRRDERDATRDHGPLQAAADAVLLDTTGLSVDGVVTRIAALARSWADP
jgi:cytidylate kinase